MNRELLKENITHGSAMFPLNLYIREMDGKGIGLDCHWHDELELFMVTKGTAVIQVEASYYELSAGQAVFINKGEIHAGHLINGVPCSFSAVVFSEQLLCSNIFDTIQNKYLDPLLKKQYTSPVLLTASIPWQNEILNQLIEIISLCITKPDTYELSVKARLYLILSFMLSNSRHKTTSERNSQSDYKIERLKKVLLYIQTSYSTRITIKELAGLINMSEGHFCRFFKSMLRKSPIEYLNYYRITKACANLENGDGKIIEVALECGFESFSYFISTFKCIMKCTPSQYRNEHGSILDNQKADVF